MEDGGWRMFDWKVIDWMGFRGLVHRNRLRASDEMPTEMRNE
jgi:hypothetical protein